MIDYALAKKQNAQIKAALTRAQKKTDPKLRYEAVLAACKLAVKAWELWGAWPDAWSRWQRALDDAYYAAQRNGYWGSDCPRLEEL
jgi:hypothetical protein